MSELSGKTVVSENRHDILSSASMLLGTFNRPSVLCLISKTLGDSRYSFYSKILSITSHHVHIWTIFGLHIAGFCVKTFSEMKCSLTDIIFLLAWEEVIPSVENYI